MAFSDVINGGSLRSKNVAVFSRRLTSDDSVLMNQVADLVPITSFGKDTIRELAA